MKEDQSEGLLPKSAVPGAHGDGAGPPQVVTEGVACFTGESSWSHLAPVRCRDVGNRDCVEAEADLVEETQPRGRKPSRCEEVHQVRVVVPEQRKVWPGRWKIDAMGRSALPCQKEPGGGET